MRKYILAPFVALLLVIGGCSSIPAPETNSERLAAAEATYQAAVQTIVDMSAQGTIKARHVDDVRAARNAARTALDMWHDAPAIDSRASTALTALRALQTILNRIAQEESR